MTASPRDDGVESALLRLPDDVWRVVFDLLDAGDVVNLASTSKWIRSWLTPSVFCRAKCTWEMAKHRPPHPEIISQLRITNHLLYSEWSVDVFPRLRTYPKLQHLLINTIDLASWLRYRRFPHLARLTLYHLLPAKKPRFFDLNSLNDFVCLTFLEIHDYHFLWSREAVPVVNLVEVVLVGCSWEFPFRLSQFNPGQFLERLSLSYQANDTFVNSQLLMEFLTKPDAEMDSLRRLEVACPRSLSPSTFNRLTHNFTHLHQLKLTKWSVTTPKFVALYLNRASLGKLTHLTVEIPDAEVAADIEDQVHREFGGLYFFTSA